MIISIKELWKIWRYGDLCMVLAALAAQSINISVGLCQGYSAILLPQLQSDRPDLTAEQASWIASLGVISNPIGALLGGMMVDAIGRKTTLQSIVVPGLVGWATIALSSSYACLCVGRFITGFTIGMSTATYIYVAEVSTASSRGVLAAVGPALVSLGIFFVYVLGSFFNWRVVAIVCAIISTINPILMQMAPESPLWLASKGRSKEACEIMCWLRQNNNIAQKEMDELAKENTEIEESFSDKMKAITSWSVMRPLMTLLLFFLFQELSGIYIILYYAVDFFKDVGSDLNEFTASIIVGGLRVLMGIVGAYLINQVRRKVLATISGVFLSVAMLGAAVCETFGVNSSIKLICVLGHVCASMIGFLQLPWIMSGELYPQKVRGVMLGVTTSCAYILIFLNIKTYPSLVELLTHNGTLYMFGACSMLGAVFCVVFLPETKGKTLSEIMQVFEVNKIPQKQEENIEADFEKAEKRVISNVISRKHSIPTIQHIFSETCKQLERKLSV